MEGDWAVGVLIGVRARHHLRTDNVGAAVHDAWRAFGLLDQGNDPSQYGRIRRLLREMRSSDCKGFDAAWATIQTTNNQPIWLQHPATDEDVHRVVIAWINTPTWDESEHMLAEDTAAFFDDRALAAIEHLIDAYPGGDNLMSHLALLAHVRTHGVHAAYTQLRQELAHANLIQIATAWLQARSHANAYALALALLLVGYTVADSVQISNDKIKVGGHLDELTNLLIEPDAMVGDFQVDFLLTYRAIDGNPAYSEGSSAHIHRAGRPRRTRMR